MNDPDTPYRTRRTGQTVPTRTTGQSGKVKQVRTLCIVLAVLLLPLPLFAQAPPAASAPGAGQGAAKLRTLIVTGDDVPAHNWRETTPVVREILESTGRFEVRVSEEPGVLASPSLASYDLVVL